MDISLRRCSIKLVVIGFLAILVLGSFAMTTFAWQHIRSGQTVRLFAGGTILILLYSMLIFELVDRNLAALIAAALSIAVHDCLIDHVSLEQIVQWQDLETLSLLLGMMIIVEVMGETGLLQWLAIWLSNKSSGRFWLMLSLLLSLVAALSAALDNVSCLLLLAPIIFRLAELQQVDPRYLLMATTVAANIGGCATPVGDVPNMIVISNEQINELGITFSQFTVICTPPAAICVLYLMVHLKLVYKTKKNFNDQQSVNHSALVKQQTLARVESDLHLPMDQLIEELGLVTTFKDHLNTLTDRVSDHNLLALIRLLNYETSRLEKAIRRMTLVRGSNTSLVKLEESSQPSGVAQEPIKNRCLVLKANVVLLTVIGLFFLQSVPEYNLSLGCIALFGALILLVLATSDSIEATKVIAKVDWPTLSFFFALFIVMEVVQALGLIEFLGAIMSKLVCLLPNGKVRLLGWISIFLWASGLASALLHNVPFTSMMVKIVSDMATRRGPNEAARADLVPLVYALALGACLGGNGTLIGASANLVVASASNKLGRAISFGMYFRFAWSITVATLLIANVWLVLVFEFAWHQQ